MLRTDAPAPALPAAGGKPGGFVRAPGLDGLRGLAVLAVLAFHEKVSALPGGFLGVDVFFVISGFLITDILAAPWGAGGRLDLRRFWLRRARRLLPCLLVVLVTVTAAVAVLEPGQMTALRPALLAALTYTSNWWQAGAHRSYFAVFGPPPPLQHLWSLAIEEQFYLVWPVLLTVILCAFARRRAWVVAAWLAAAASALAMAAGYVAGEDPSRLYYGTDTHATALLAGAGLALCLPLRRLTGASRAQAQRLDLAGLAGISVLILAMVHLPGTGGALYLGGMAVAAAAATAVVAAAAAPGGLARMIGWAPLRWLGVRSYGIYLWHWPVIALVAARDSGQASTAGVRLAETAATIGLAALSWRWVEAPVIRDGLAATARARWASLARAMARAGRSPQRLLPAALVLLVAIGVAGTAGYGVLYTPPGESLQQQIAAGTRVSTGSRASTGTRASTGSRASATSQGRPAHAKRARQSAGRKPGILGSYVTAVGDSVMLASAPQLQAQLPGIYIDARVSRQMSQGVTLVRRLATRHALRPIVVVGLGTNGPVTVPQIQALIRAVGPARVLVLVSTYVPRPWQGEVNLALAATARRYHDVTLANWFATIRGRTDLLWPDGVHPRPRGAAVYARMLASAARTAAATIG